MVRENDGEDEGQRCLWVLGEVAEPDTDHVGEHPQGHVGMGVALVLDEEVEGFTIKDRSVEDVREERGGLGGGVFARFEGERGPIDGGGDRARQDGGEEGEGMER